MGIDDVPHKSIAEYEWSSMAYFRLSSPSGTPELTTDGLDYPCSMEVLPAGKFSDEDGEIFNRAYSVQNDIFFTHMHFASSSPSGDNVWIDSASMAASIHQEPNKYDWKKLTCKPFEYSQEDDSVPPRMRESVEKLKDRTIYLDDSYFTTILEQLKSFLSMIMDELNQSFNQGEIEELCDFNYSISNIKFKNYDYDDGNWNKSGVLGVGGLFGYDEAEKDIYTSCVKNFNNHLLDEFSNDWRKLTPIVDDKEPTWDNPNPNYIGNRDYHYILSSSPIDYTSAANISELRNDTL